MTPTRQLSSVVSSCFYQLRRIKSLLNLLPFDIARTVVNSYIISRIDYCNSLLANSSQRVMNAAARLVRHSGRLTRVSGLLRDRLHWLRVPERVRYKLMSSGLQSCPWLCTSELVLVSARQHTAISGFHVRRPTLMTVHVQSPGGPASSVTLCRISRN